MAEDFDIEALLEAPYNVSKRKRTNKYAKNKENLLKNHFQMYVCPCIYIEHA